MDACSIMYERKEQTIVYCSFPQTNDLCCAICETDFIEVRDSSAKSNFHWQTMKCRLLIHLIPDIIASPVMGTERFIFVIAHKKIFEAGRLERILRNFKLVYQGLRSITPELYKSCLAFTIQTKIAPLWNKVGNYFVQGKEFYNFTEGIRALRLDILVEEMDIRLQLYTNKVKIPYIKLEDYLSPSVISHFLADPKGYIDLSNCNVPFVHVLPSTKKGKLLSVSKELSTKCVFKDYDQLRRHWKNMYGYSLPKSKDGILYYEIKFLIPRSKIFTYPSLCVVSGPLDIISSTDDKSTATHFLSDMLIKLPIVCGKQLQISKHTPFSTKFLNTKLSDTSPKEKGLNTYLRERDNNSSQFEFSTTYANELMKDTNATTSLETQLAKIHEIHNIPFQENIKADSSKNIKENQNGTVQNLSAQDMKNVCIQDNTSIDSNGNFTLSKEETISKYFKIQKAHTSVNKPIKEEKYLTTKEKLLKIKSNKNSKATLQEMDQSINVEAMARSNQLDQIKTSVLSGWLKTKSIPHNSRGKKSELISKVLSHMKNTQILHQFRM